MRGTGNFITNIPLIYKSCCITIPIENVLLPGPKTLFLDRYYFHPSVCVCVSVCVYVSVYIDYLKKFLTDFDETWQDDV